MVRPAMIRPSQVAARFSAIPAPVRGALWMLFSACCFAGVATSVHTLAGTVHPFEIAFFRTFFLFIFLSPLLWRSGWSVVRTRHLKLHIFRSLISVAAMMAWFSALGMMPIAEVTALTFTAPLFTTVGAAVILREDVGIRRWGAVVVGFAGTLVILRPGGEVLAPGAIIALLAALFMAAVPLTMKVLSRNDPPTTVVLLVAMLSTPLSLVPALFVWTMPPLAAWPWLVMAGLFASGIQWGMAKAYDVADVTAVLPFDFSRLIFVALAGYLMFGEVLDIWTGLGATIIFSATLYTVRREARLARRAKAPLSPSLPDR